MSTMQSRRTFKSQSLESIVQVNRDTIVRGLAGGLIAGILLIGTERASAQGSGGDDGSCEIDGSPAGVCEDCDGNGVRDECELVFENGLLGQYFTSQPGQDYFAERVLIRTDSEVGFEWGNGSPAFGLPSDDFSVRWTGTLEGPVSGLVEISTVSDDGVRLWVDDLLLIENWTNHGSNRDIGVFNFEAGQRVPIRLEYYEAGGDATCKLEWRLPGEEDFALVPQEMLRPDTDIDGDGFPDSCYADCNGNGLNDLVEVATGAVEDCNANCSPDECDAFQKDIAGYWRFEGSGTVLVDAGPNALDGSLGESDRRNDVDAYLIPQTGDRNEYSVKIDEDVLVVPDPNALLRFPEDSFTIEAWVRLDALSNNSDDNSQRQYILQKKPLESYDSQLGYAFMAQGGNIAGASLYALGKSSGISGRELVLRFGLGDGGSSNSWSITSFLEINDLEWHFVSVSWDQENEVARFVLDDMVDEIQCFDFGRAIGQGALRIGGHSNYTGALNQFLKGSIDEVRISPGVKPLSRLLDRNGAIDCNENGVLDYCDIVNGTSADIDLNGVPDECEDCNLNGLPDTYETEQGLAEDCNGNQLPDECDIVDGDCDGNSIPDDCQLDEDDCNDNGIVDTCDISNGTSEDCQSDGIPDECQLSETIVYAYTDGFPEYGVRPDSGTHFTWCNGFRVENGAYLLDAIEISYVYISRGTPVTVYVWRDPTGDFNPEDAELILGFSSVVDMPDLSQGWRRQVVSMPEQVDLGPDGSVFFVGVSHEFSIPDDFPAGLDISSPTFDGRSWHISTDGPINPNDLTERSTEFGPIDEVLFSSNWDLIAVTSRPFGDCNTDGIVDVCQVNSGESADLDGNGIPDECEDCNGNGILDAFDIEDGTSLDCQPDGIPDECQLIAGDCNGDGLPDSCAPDCDGDGLPDECEIASGESEDIDGNGVPDTCEDCNNNGIPDGLDIPPNGDSLDCQGDGIPDECQLGTADSDSVGNNDGTQERLLTLGTPGWIVWLEQLTVESGNEYLDAIELLVPEVPVDSLITLFIGTDLGTGAPGELDIKVVAERPIPVAGEWFAIDMFDTYIGSAGTTYYVGAMFYDKTPGWNKPISIDSTLPQNKAWVAYSTIEAVDPEQIEATSEVFDRLGAIVTNGNYLLNAVVFDGTRSNDADGDTIPDDCTGGGCTGDVDGDGMIDGVDLTELLGLWGTSDPSVDFDGNGLVDGNDLTVILGNWGICR